MLLKNSQYSGEPELLVSANRGVLLHRKWKGCTSSPTVFIGHGQATHSGQYLDICNGFHALGWSVHAGDLRGHGGSTAALERLGHFPEECTWGMLVDDLHHHLQIAFDDVPFQERVVVAENISALATLDLLQRDPDLADTLVLTLPVRDVLAVRFAKAFVKERLKRFEPTLRDNPTLHHFYTYLRRQIQGSQRLEDVLSADLDVVEKILVDPASFPIPSLNYLRVVLDGIEQLWTSKPQKAINPETRILLLNGTQDVFSPTVNAQNDNAAWLSKFGANKIARMQVPGARAAPLLDESRLSVSKRIESFIENGDGAEHIERQPIHSVHEIRENVCPRYECGLPDGHKTTPQSLVARCYDAVGDDQKWAELLALLAQIGVRENTLRMEEYLAYLMPHLDRLYEINQKINRSNTLGSLLENLVDRLDVGTAIIEHDLTVTYHNDVFAKCLRHLYKPAENRDVASDFKMLACREFKQKISTGSETAVLCHDGHPVGHYFKHSILSSGNQAHSQHKNGSSGILLVRVPGVTNPSASLSSSTLETAYGLTAQEAAVSLEITNGLSPCHIAKKLNISINTVRTHLKRCYEKVDVEGQTELVARLMRGPIGWLS